MNHQPSVLTATFEIVTPMFLGGAEHKASRIRGSAIKGALAFWWRALNFARFVKEADGDAKEALQKMRQRERELFGFGGNKGGLGAFLLRVRHGDLKTIQQKKILLRDGTQAEPIGIDLNEPPRELPDTIGVGARYLGYGIISAFTSREDRDLPWAMDNIRNFGGQLERDCFCMNQTFEVDLIFRSIASDTDVSELVYAVKLFGLLGGLGARVRRGWGSVALVSLEGDIAGETSIPYSKEEYTDQIRKLLNLSEYEREGKDWPLSAFAVESRIWCQEDMEDTALNALDRLGRAFLNYRANGRGQNMKVGGQPILKQFREDHDWFRNGANGVDIPYRTAFGLPHMYDSQKGFGVAPAGDADRRASPLMMHIHKTSEGSFGVLVYIPTRFLDEQVSATRPRGGNTTRAYDLHVAYGARNASGDDVIKSFVGESKKFKRNTVINFVPVLP